MAGIIAERWSELGPLALWQLSQAYIDRSIHDRSAPAGWSRSIWRWRGLRSPSSGATATRARRSSDFTATVMKHQGGRWLIAIIGLVIVGIGVYHVYNSVQAQSSRTCVARNDGVAQGVRHRSSVLAANFCKPGTVGHLTSDAPACAIARRHRRSRRARSALRVDH